MTLLESWSNEFVYVMHQKEPTRRFCIHIKSYRDIGIWISHKLQTFFIQNFKYIHIQLAFILRYINHRFLWFHWGIQTRDYHNACLKIIQKIIIKNHRSFLFHWGFQTREYHNAYLKILHKIMIKNHRSFLFHWGFQPW